MSNSTTQTESVQTGVRVPVDLWKRTKRVALDLEVTAQQIVTDALEAYLSKLERRKPS